MTKVPQPETNTQEPTESAREHLTSRRPEGSPPWIRWASIDGPEEELQALEGRGVLIHIEGGLCFDLQVWATSNLRLPNIAPPLPADRQADLFLDVRTNGVHTPVILDGQTWQVIDGHHRLAALLAARQAGSDVPIVGFTVLGNLKAEDADAARVRSALKTRLSAAERSALISNMVMAYPDWSDRRIAAEYDIRDHKLVSRARKRLLADGKIEHHSKRLSLSGEVEDVDAIRAARETKGRKRSASDDPEAARLLEHWRRRFGSLLLTEREVVEMAASIDLKLSSGGVAKPREDNRMSHEFSAWLASLAKGRFQSDGMVVHRREVVEGCWIFQLIDVRLLRRHARAASRSLAADPEPPSTSG